MHIGVPTETKPEEGRVGLVPEAAAALRAAGHEVSIQRGAGIASGYPDHAYAQRGIRIQDDAESLYAAAELIIKVKEPWGSDLTHLRHHHLLFCFLHLAAQPDLSRRLCGIGLTAIGFETVLEPRGLPILAPMSEIAGRIAVQAGTHYLHAAMGGKGKMLGGLPTVPRGKVVVLGAGNAGGSAAQTAAAMGAQVTVFDRDAEKLTRYHRRFDNVTALYPYQDALDRAVSEADLLIGAILLPGRRATRLVSREQVAAMETGSVIVDIAVDQGGCIATTRPTDYRQPTYVEQGVVHFAVTNMPGAVPRTASAALSVALLPYAQRLAAGSWEQDPVLAAAVNVRAGKLVHPALL